MSSTIDPAKLKVVDLRSELASRGLDTKGNKAVLVKRLKDALEDELKQDLPDTSIADTSTEDLDTSQNEGKIQETSKTENDNPQADEKMETDEPKSVKIPPSDSKPVEKPVASKSPEKPNIVKTPTKVESPAKLKVAERKSETSEPAKTATSKEETDEKTEENGEHSEQPVDEKARKSRWGDEEKAPEGEESQQSEENKKEDGQSEPAKIEGSTEQKGEKRRRSSASPERSQRRRSRSPIKEDEPALDNDKVQLSWYDSDLHLQLDKESFLSAKPLTEGAFGYAWAGVRATHGVSSGKVCYEVKITEEIKWEDFAKFYEQRGGGGGGRDRYRTDHRKNQKRDKDKKDLEKKSGDKAKSNNGDPKNDKSTEKDGNSADQDESALKDEKSVKESDSTEEKPSEIEEKPSETEKKPSETEKMDDSSAEAEEKKEVSEKADETPMETDESKKPEEAEAESTSKEKDTEEKKAEPPSEPIPTHLVRVGWSLINGSLQLGEEKLSYGYESSAKFVTDKQFVDYGSKFGAGDVVGAFLSIDEETVSIRYTINGEIQPVAITVPRTEFPEENFALFPHVLSRNYAFELNLGDKEEPWFPIPSELEGYSYLSKVEDKISGPTRPENRGECEVILMCGLPASGKTYWVKEHVKSNLDKRYTVIGNTNLLDKMTVSGQPLKSKFKGRWSWLVDKLQKCLNKLISLAALRRRNFIIDQTNVFPSAQRRKMRPFEGFKRRAVIVVVGDEEQARRQSLQEAQDGKDVPDSTILEMKAAMSLPEKGDWIEEVTYAELEETEAKDIVKKYNTAGKEAGYGVEKRFGRRDDRWQNRRNDYRGKNYRDRSYHSQRYDPRGSRQGGWSNPRPGGGNWNRDRRDNRGPPAREWRGSGRDLGSRDNRNQAGNYNRSRGQGGSRGQGTWSGSSWGGGQGWNQQTFGSGGGSYGSQNWNNQWKYGGGSNAGGQGYGGYGNWNYYGQYAQNWNSQGQQTQAATSGTETANSQYGQGYNTQEAWAQYAQQYAQQAAATQNQAAAITKK